MGQGEEVLAGQPEVVQDEIIRINTEARTFALQVALMIPLLAALIGLLNSFRMMRLPDPEPSGSPEGDRPGLTPGCPGASFLSLSSLLGKTYIRLGFASR